MIELTISRVADLQRKDISLLRIDFGTFAVAYWIADSAIL